jgi:hypothetical protein
MISLFASAQEIIPPVKFEVENPISSMAVAASTERLPERQ